MYVLFCFACLFIYVFILAVEERCLLGVRKHTHTTGTQENNPLQSRGGSQKTKHPLTVFPLFQMDVGTVYREPREFLSPWPNPDILEASQRHSFGGAPFFFLVL